MMRAAVPFLWVVVASVGAISSREGDTHSHDGESRRAEPARYVAADLDGFWASKEWVGAAKKGGRPDPTKDQRVVFVYESYPDETDESKDMVVNFPRISSSTKDLVDKAQPMPFTLGDLVFDMTSDGDLRVEFRYESGWAEIIYTWAPEMDNETGLPREPAQPGCFSKALSFIGNCVATVFGALVIIIVLALVYSAIESATSAVGRVFGVVPESGYVMVPLPSDDSFTIRIRSPQGEETFFKVKKTTWLQKVFNAYAQRLGVAATSLVYTFDDVVVSGDKTVADYDMADGDQLDVRAA